MNGNEAFDINFTTVVLTDVLNEGVHARQKHGDAPVATNEEALQVLTEEVGEVAKALNQNLPEEEFRKELIQVASVAIRHLAGDLTFSRKP
jgi:hypothetical protein